MIQPPATEIPKLPATALVWDGPLAESKIVAAGFDTARIAVALGMNPSTTRRWVQPRGRPSAASPPLHTACDLAALVLGDAARVTEFLSVVDRATGRPVKPQPRLPGTD